MNKKRILHIISILTAFISLIASGIISNNALDSSLCSNVKVMVDYKTSNFFVKNADIMAMLNKPDDSIKGKQCRLINVDTIEQLITAHPSIKEVDVYITINGQLTINVLQREPIVRIINTNNESYYIDKDGLLMPLSDNFTARVPIVNGKIFEPYQLRYKTQLIPNDTGFIAGKLLQDIYMLSKYIYNQDFWRAQIAQIYVNEYGEFELIPRVGKHVINFGGIDNYKNKFCNLYIFYKRGIGVVGWNKYSKLDVRYKNQIVCTKN